MNQLIIEGGRPLCGAVRVQGSKNVFLHLAAASLLTSERVLLHGVPRITDTGVVVDLLREIGTTVDMEDTTLSVRAADLISSTIPSKLGRAIRPTACLGASILARTGRTVFPLPGGDAFAERKIDLHLAAMRQAGASVHVSDRMVHVVAPPTGLRGFTVSAATRSFGPSLGATVTAVLLAARADGTSRITQASLEPEVAHVLRLLSDMGVPIMVEDSTIHVEGGRTLHGAEHQVPPDRMVAGTLAIAAAITGGDIELDVNLEDLTSGFVSTADDAGVVMSATPTGMRVQRGQLRAVRVETGVHPGYPSDLQPQITGLLTQAPGASRVREKVYSQRGSHVAGLAAMGARILPDGQDQVIHGPTRLRGATVRGEDIRAAASLLIAALVAEGRTVLTGVAHLRRGYEDFPATLRLLGADITEVELERA